MADSDVKECLTPQKYPVDNKKPTNISQNTPVPTQLLAEFLYSVMKKDYEKALDCCTQILNYEPNNSTALEFYPLILEKLEMKLEDDSSSESSETYSSSSSSSSESNLFRNGTLGSISLSEQSKSFEMDKINEFGASYVIPLERKFKTGNVEILKPNPSHQKLETNCKIPTQKETKKNKIKNNACIQTDLTGPQKQKKSLKGEGPLNSETKALANSKQVNRKVQRKSIACPKPTKVLLHMTETKTISKISSTSKD